jgi:hypothetical protein
MELLAEEFSRIVSSLSGQPLSDSKGENRRAARVHRQIQISIVPIVGGAPGPAVSVRVKNLSSRGIGLVRDKGMAVGSQFLVRLARDVLGAIELLCTVVHCTAQGDDMWSIGAEFTCVSPGAQVVDSAEADRIRNSMLG